MAVKLDAKMAGLGIGFACGLLFVILGWQAFLILVAFTAGGLLGGICVEQGHRIRRRLGAFVDRILRL